MAAADGVKINVCARNRESAECLSLDAAKARHADAITPDMVDPRPATSTALYSQESWRHYCLNRFGAAGAALATTLFSHLESKDVIPGDGYLDVSSVPRDATNFVFEHLHPFSENPEATQDTLDAMQSDMVQTQQRLIPIYVTQVGAQLIGATENGVVRSLVGNDLQRAWDEMRKAYPSEDVARVVVDARYFTGRDSNDLNPDRRGMWAPMLYNGASLAVSGGVGVFDPSQVISALPYSTRMPGFGPGELDNFITVLSVALLLLAMARRSGGAAAPVPVTEPNVQPKSSRFDALIPKGMMAQLQLAIATRGRGIPALFMSHVRNRGKSPQGNIAPESTRNEWYTLPAGITYSNVPLVGRSYVQGNMTMRPITHHGLVHYVVDARSAAPREGFCLLRESEGMAPLFIPIDMIRNAVLQGELAQTPFRAPYTMPAVPFRDGPTGKLLNISPSWNLHPKPAQNNGHVFDPHAQIVGVVVKNHNGEVVVSLPWVEGWMSHSPMTYDPLREAPHQWVMPRGWRGGSITLSQRADAAGAILKKTPELDYLTAPQQEALSMLAAAVASPKMDSGVAGWAVNAVLQGRRSTVYVANQVADVLRTFPVEWAFNRSISVGLDARESLSPEIVESIEARVTRTHEVFPALNSHPVLFPPPGGALPYVRRVRVKSQPAPELSQPRK